MRTVVIISASSATSWTSSRLSKLSTISSGESCLAVLLHRQMTNITGRRRVHSDNEPWSLTTRQSEPLTWYSGQCVERIDCICSCTVVVPVVNLTPCICSSLGNYRDQHNTSSICMLKSSAYTTICAEACEFERNCLPDREGELRVCANSRPACACGSRSQITNNLALLFRFESGCRLTNACNAHDDFIFAYRD